MQPATIPTQVSLEDCILALLRGIQNHSVIAEETDGQEFRSELAALESRNPGSDGARQLVNSAIEILDKYGAKTNQVIARQQSGLVTAAAELTSAIKALPGFQGSAERWSLVEEQINSIALNDDLESVKARLRADVAMARAEALQERQKVSALLSAVISRLGLSSLQLSSEASAPSGPVYTADQLTGLPSRAYAEAELTRAHAQFPDCYLALFVVKRLGLINTKFGYSRGDQVLLKVVVHLAQSLPEFNNLFRWAPCAFLTVAPPNTLYRDLRAKVQMIELARMTPTLEWEGRSAMVPVALDCRIIAVKDFEKTSELFLRLDSLSSDV